MSDQKYNEMSESEKSLKFNEKLQLHLNEFSNKTGIHGFYYLSENRSRTEKIFWGVTILLSFIGCTIMIVQIVDKYNKYPVVISFSPQDTPLYDIPFPAVTICPESKTSGGLSTFSEQIKTRSFQNQTLDAAKEIKIWNYLTLLCDDFKDLVLSEGNLETVDDDFLDMMDEFKPKDSIYCSYMDPSKQCNHYVTPIITDKGICYSFNILDREEIFRNNIFHYKNFQTINNKSSYDEDYGYDRKAGVDTYPLRALISGAQKSLTILFIHNQSADNEICRNRIQGFKIALHSPNDIPRVSKSYFRVPFNKAVDAAVKPDFMITSKSARYLTPDKRSCYLQNERPLKYFKLYTQSNCLLECVTNYTLNKCGCVNYYMPRFNETKICGTGNSDCVNSAELQQKIEEVENKITHSGEVNSCDCKPSCNNLRYNVEISYSDFSWQDFDVMAENVVDNTASCYYSALSIYFKEEQFRALERNELYGTSDLVSNFGGLLGLFIGISLVSLVEIVYFLTLRIVYNIKLFGRWWNS